ncbi:MAG: twin-arginine translocase TatA/TatE family subunit [Vulcanimicrobiaceae bacterium]
MEIAIVVGAAVLLFGGNKIRDVARGLGAAQREFKVGQAEADAEAERIRAAAGHPTVTPAEKVEPDDKLPASETPQPAAADKS